MKKIVYIILSLLLCVGAVGGTVALANHLTEQVENNSSVEEPKDDPTNDVTLKEGETLLTDPADFRVNRWYRFYVDESNPESEAYIVLNLVRDDGGFDGGFTEVGSDIEVDMPKVTIGISTAFTGQGYIYWNDTMRLSVDAEVGGGDNYFDIYLEENVFTGMGDNETTPSIWFELTQHTECLEIGNKGGGYVVVLDSEQDGSVSGGSTNEETTTPLVAPVNEAALICDDLEMVSGAQLYLGTDTERPAMRFTCNITSELKAEVEADSTKKLAMLLIPTKFFDRVNPSNYTYIDWVNAFNDAGIDSYYLSEFEVSQLGQSGDNYYMRFRLEEIPYGAMNMEVSCLGVLIDNSGSTPTYTYSKLPEGATYRSNARSVAYVASASLNAYTLGLETFDDAQLAKIQSYINEAVDEANGLESATADGSMFEISTNGTTKTLSVGETFQISASYTPSNVNVPIWYRSNDTSVVTVDDNGLITAVGTGTAVIGIYVAGEVVGITITIL